MPFYEFECKSCKVKYDFLSAYDATGKYAKAVCPECGSKKKNKLVSACSFAFAQPQGTDKWNSQKSGHDYRFKHNIPKVKEERAVAESLSHMGSNPYGDGPSGDLQLDTGIHDAETRSGLS